MSWGPNAEDWGDAANALANERAGRGPEHFPHALGVDPEGMREFAAEDAIDTLKEIVGVDPARTQVARVPVDIMLGALATHFQIGVELGLWLAQTGRVQS